MTDKIIQLFTEFDEKGFAPTTLSANPEKEAAEWKQQLIDALTEKDNEIRELEHQICVDRRATLKLYEDKDRDQFIIHKLTTTDQQINIYEKRAQVDVLERLLKYKTLGLGIINTRCIINIELYRIRAEIRKEESKIDNSL